MSYFILFLFLFVGAQVAYYFLLPRFLDVEERASEVHTIKTPDGWIVNLYRFPPSEGVGEPVFICHGLSANHTSFCFPKGHSLAEHLSRRGYDCWLIDLRGTRSSVPPLGTRRYDATFDGYLLGDIPSALDFITKTTGFEKVHWVGHSMGGMLLYAYELTHGADRIASGTTIGSPPGLGHVNTGDQKHVVSVLTHVPWLCEFYLRCLIPLYPILKPSTRLVPINWKNLHPLIGAEAFYGYAELPSPLVVKMLSDCAAHHCWYVKGNTIDVLAGLRHLRVPLLVIHGKLDPLATTENVRAFFEKLPSDDKQLLELSRDEGCVVDYDHVDLVLSHKGPDEVFEPIADWIAAHSMGEAGIAESALEVLSEPEVADAEPAEVDETIETVEVEPVALTRKASAKKQSLWGAALKDAAGIMSTLEGSAAKTPKEAPHVEVIAKPRKKLKPQTSTTARSKKAAAKTVSTKKTTAKKTGAKKVSTKKSVASKPTKKRKSSAAKSSKKAAGKKSTKKAAKPKATKKKVAKKATKRKPTRKPKSPKKAKKKKSTKKTVSKKKRK